MRASRVSAVYGAKVAIAESGLFGGTCVNVGCIPKKLFSTRRISARISRIAQASAGRPASRRFDWRTLLANKDREIARLNGCLRASAQRGRRQIIRGRATIVDPHTVEVERPPHTAKHILVATGCGRCCRRSRPRAWRSARTRRSISSACRSARGGRRRLHRARVRVDLPGPGREDDALVSRRAAAARIRRRARRAPGRGDDAEGRGRPLRRRAGEIVQHGDCLGSSSRRRHTEDRPGAVRHRTQAQHRDLGLERAGVELAATARSWSTGTPVPASIRSTPSATSPTASTSRRSRPPRRCGLRNAVPRRADASRSRNVPTAVFATRSRHRRPERGEARERYGAVDIYRPLPRRSSYTLTGEGAHAS